MIDLEKLGFEDLADAQRALGSRVDRGMRVAMRQYGEEVAGQVQQDIGEGGYRRIRQGRTWRVPNPMPRAGRVFRRTGELAGSINAASEKRAGQWVSRVGTPKRVGLYLWRGTSGGPGHGKAIPLEVITGQPERDARGRRKWVRIKRRGPIRARPYFEDAAAKKEHRGEALIDRAIRDAIEEAGMGEGNAPD